MKRDSDAGGAKWNKPNELITQGTPKNSISLKGVFTKYERGYIFTAKNKRFWSLLILLLSVASIKRKLIKRLILKNVASIQIQKVAIFNSDRKKSKLIPNKSFIYYNHTIINFFGTIVNSWHFIIIFILFFLSIFRLQLVFAAGAGFSNIPGKYENVVFIIKNPRNMNECFQK